MLAPLDAFAKRVVALLASAIALPEGGLDPWMQIRIAEHPTLSMDSGHLYQVLAGRSVPKTAAAICLSGDELWLSRALTALVQLSTLQGVVCIDFADFRQAFFGRGPVRGVSVDAGTLAMAAAGALHSAVELVQSATWVLVHIEAGAPLPDLKEIVAVAAAVEQAAENREINVLFNFYDSLPTGARVTLLIV